PLAHYVATAPRAERRATDPEFGPKLAPLVPDLRRRLPELTPAPTEPQSERYRLFEAVVGLLSGISSKAPVLLVLDDLHRADRPTLLLLRHLARAPQPRRLLILVAYRTEASEDYGLADVLSDLRREGLIAQLDIAGL